MKTTVISVLYKDFGLFDYMIQTALASSDNIAQILVYDTGDNDSIIQQYSSDIRIKFIKGRNTGNGSVSHGMGLNKLLPLVNTPITAIIEPDVILLNRGWDDLPDEIDLRAGFKSKYKEYPCYLPCFMVGRTDKLRSVDFMPGTTHNITELAAPSDVKTFFDVGWRVSRANLAVETLEFKRCIDGQCSIIPNDIFSKKTNEFWLDGKAIASHLWRGSDPVKRGKFYKEDFDQWMNVARDVLKRLHEKA